MNLQAHYDALRETALRELAQGRAELDALLDAPDDTRRGITLLARPPAPVAAAVRELMADFQAAEPEQYYYPAADIHLTILSIISCYPGFALGQIAAEQYQAVVRGCLREVPPLTIRFAGLTASAGGIMVQGFPQDEGLSRLRDQLRAAFRQSGLQQSIDQRYRIQTAHSTIIRYRSLLRDPGRVLSLIRQHQGQHFGDFTVSAVELVFNDWYQRAGNTVLLEQYPLAPGALTTQLLTTP